MKMWKSREWYYVMAATLLLFGFNLYGTISRQNPTSHDFSLYAKFIDPMKQFGTITTPHFIYPLLVAVASTIFPDLSYSVLGAGIVLLFQLLVASILWKFWKQILADKAPYWIASGLTLACMLIAPINLLTPHSGYFGYIGITVYHNPSILICRPIALLHFLVFAAVITSGVVSPRQTVLCFISIVIAALMKPNYALIMVPTAALFAVWSIFRKRVQTFNFILFGTLLPALLILAWQYHFTYISENSLLEQSHVIFKPFFVYADRSQYLFPKFIFSVLFPLSVLILFGKQTLYDRYYVIGLLLFLFGAMQSYLFAESGSRLYDGNFLWSAQIGLFLWFIVSMRFVVLRFFSGSNAARRSPAIIVLCIIFSLHVISGIVWYAHETIAPGAFW